MALRPEGHGDSQGGLPDEWSIYFHHIYVPNGLRLPFFALELELIQTQMAQKPMLRAEVYARALRASQNRKEDSV